MVLARRGSRGVPGKNRALVGGRPCVAWTIRAALEAETVDLVVVSTDDAEVARIARQMKVVVVRRPARLATARARVDDAARHAVARYEAAMCDRLGPDVPVVLLYGNVPVRPGGLIDRAVRGLRRWGCDSVQSYAPVGKYHPWWTARVERGTGRVRPWERSRLNGGAWRRQDLPPAFVPDGGVVVVRRGALMGARGGGGPHAFLGRDHRAVVTRSGEVIDIDGPEDLLLADAVLRGRARGARRGNRG